MIKCRSYDPRRRREFPDLDYNNASVNEMRDAVCGSKKEYYELWKVHRKHFVLESFKEMVAMLPKQAPKTTPKKQPSTSNSPTEQPPNPNSPTEQARTIVPRVKIVCMFNGTDTVEEYESKQ